MKKKVHGCFQCEARKLGSWEAGQQQNQKYKYLGALKFIDQSHFSLQVFWPRACKLPGLVPSSFLASCLQA